MDPLLLRVFLHQVQTQCEYLLTAAAEVNNAIKQNNIRLVFYGLQNLLTANANISKALWGSKGKKADARKPIRDAIGIDENSPLREVVMRNNFEHFDERIDCWWERSPNHNFSDHNLGNKNAIGLVEEINRFRLYDTQTRHEAALTRYPDNIRPTWGQPIGWHLHT